jgi:hypothetical protein
MPKKNEWASRFGAKRKALDKAYCAAAEAAIVAPVSVNVAPVSVNVAPASPIVAQVRPWQAQLDALQDERRRELKLLTEENIRTI